MTGRETSRPAEAEAPADLAQAVQEARASLDRLLRLLAASPGSAPSCGTEEMLGVARRLSRERRERDRILGSALFGEPAWDILLELFAARSEGRRLTAMSACMASGVPSTTALRWLTKLEEADLVQRSQDERDGRVTLFDLTDDAVDSMNELMSCLAHI